MRILIIVLGLLTISATLFFSYSGVGDYQVKLHNRAGHDVTVDIEFPGQKFPAQKIRAGTIKRINHNPNQDGVLVIHINYGEQTRSFDIDYVTRNGGSTYLIEIFSASEIKVTANGRLLTPVPRS